MLSKAKPINSLQIPWEASDCRVEKLHQKMIRSRDEKSDGFRSAPPTLHSLVLFCTVFTMILAAPLGAAFAVTCGKHDNANYDELVIMPGASTGMLSVAIVRVQGHIYPGASPTEVSIQHQQSLGEADTIYVVTQATFNKISMLLCQNSLPPCFEAPYPRDYFYEVEFVLGGQYLGIDDDRVVKTSALREMILIAKASVQNKKP